MSNRQAGAEESSRVPVPLKGQAHRIVMIALTIVFVVLYVLALLGWLRGPAENPLVQHLQPIVFAIVGYYFGRDPGERAAKRMEVEAAEQRAGRERVEARLSSIGAALDPARRTLGGRRLAALTEEGKRPLSDEELRSAVEAALRILDLYDE